MTDERGVIEGQGVLDLSHLTSPDELAAITRISRVGAVVLPESLAGAYAAIPVSKVGATVFVPAGLKPRVHVGPLIVGGDGIGAPDEMLVVVGVLVITGQVTGELPGRISVVGSVFAPRGSEAALGRVFGSGFGTVTYYRCQEGQNGPHVKMLSGQVRLSGAALANHAGEPSGFIPGDPGNARLAMLADRLAHCHPLEPHECLQAMAVLPGRDRQGIAGALLASNDPGAYAPLRVHPRPAGPRSGRRTWRRSTAT